MANIPSSLDVGGHAIDHSWHYGCLDGEKGEKQDIAEKDANNQKEVREGEKQDIAEKDANNQKEVSNTIRSPCVSKDYADEDVECVACIFRVLDKNGDGQVSVEEVMAFMERLSLEMSKEEVELAMRSMSACGDKFLTAMEFSEFYKMVFRKEEEIDVDQAISAAFCVFDQNGDGLISAMELADVLCRLELMKSKDVVCCQRMIQSVDHNGDGFVDIQEFKHLISRTNSTLHDHSQCVNFKK